MRLEIPESVPNDALDGYIIEVVCSGKDVEYWAGNYGTRFRREKVLFELASPITAATSEESKNASNYEKSLVTLFGTSKVPLTDHFSCFFQAGMGASYFIDGTPISAIGCGNYSNLSEFDWTLGFNRTLENVEKAWITTDGEHFIGGTSLVISGADGEPVTLQEFELDAEAAACRVDIVYKVESHSHYFNMLLLSTDDTVPLFEKSTAIEGTEWKRASFTLEKQPKELCFSLTGQLRIGLVSIVKNSSPEGEEVKGGLEIEEQKSFTNSHFNLVERIEGRVLNKRIADITFCWKFADGHETQLNEQTKYFRVYRTTKLMVKEPTTQFLGVTNAMMYVDKDAEI